MVLYFVVSPQLWLVWNEGALYVKSCTFARRFEHLWTSLQAPSRGSLSDHLNYIRGGVCRSQWPRGLRRSLRPLPCCDRGFESHRGMDVCLLCVLCVVTRWSLVQRSPTDCGASLCVIKKPRGRGGHSPRWVVEPEKTNVEACIRKFQFITVHDLQLVLQTQECLPTHFLGSKRWSLTIAIIKFLREYLHSQARYMSGPCHTNI
jgi:hypothetical protein